MARPALANIYWWLFSDIYIYGTEIVEIARGSPISHWSVWRYSVFRFPGLLRLARNYWVRARGEVPLARARTHARSRICFPKIRWPCTCSSATTSFNPYCVDPALVLLDSSGREQIWTLQTSDYCHSWLKIQIMSNQDPSQEIKHNLGSLAPECYPRPRTFVRRNKWVVFSYIKLENTSNLIMLH